MQVQEERYDGVKDRVNRNRELINTSTEEDPVAMEVEVESLLRAEAEDRDAVEDVKAGG